jgi:GNAT superfamily N-acetyltransferase
MEMLVEIVLLAHHPSAAPEVAGWLFREWGYRNPGSTLERSIQRFWLRSNVDRLPIALLAIDEGKPVGTASLVEVEYPEDEPGPWVSGVYVLPQHRGKGIAAALMRRLEGEAVRLGARRLLLGAATPKLYRRLGYTATGAIKYGEPVMMKAVGSFANS